MTDDLLKELADQLTEAACRAPSPNLGGADMVNDEGVAMAVARECLRQMEWAADKAYKAGRSSGFSAATHWPGSPLNEEQGFGPMRTLAPPEWKP